MRLTPDGDQRVDPRLLARLDIPRAEITRVRQQRFGLAQFRGQGFDLVQHRLDLLLVVGSLNHIHSNPQHASCRHSGLCIVALLEAATGCRHDARLFIGEIDLIARQQSLGWRLRRLAARLPARRRGLGRARREFGFMLGQFSRVTLPGPRFNLRARFGDLAQTLLEPHGVDVEGRERKAHGKASRARGVANLAQEMRADSLAAPLGEDRHVDDQKRIRALLRHETADRPLIRLDDLEQRIRVLRAIGEGLPLELLPQQGFPHGGFEK